MSLGLALGSTSGPWIAACLSDWQMLLPPLAAANPATGLSSHLVYPAGLATLGAALLHLRRSQRRAAAQHRQELALRRESLAYLRFNGTPRIMPVSEFARQVSHLIASHSSFDRAALLLRDGTGTLAVTGSTGFDDLSVKAVNRWSSGVSCSAGSLTRLAAGGHLAGALSFTLRLDRRQAQRSPLSSMSCREVHIVPIGTAASLLGALVVCTECRSASRPALGFPTHSELPLSPANSPSLPLADLLEPLEALAFHLAAQLMAPEKQAAVESARSFPCPASRSARPSLRTTR